MRNGSYIKVILYIIIACSILSSIFLLVGGVFLGVAPSYDDSYDYLTNSIIVCPLLIYIGMGLLTRAFLFIDFIRTRDIDEIQENRWALIVLSLGISSFWIPILLRRTDPYGANSQGTPARYYLAKWFSMIWLVSALSGLFALIGFPMFNKNVSGVLSFVSNKVDATSTDDAVRIFSIVMLSIWGTQIVISLLAMPAVYAQNSLETYENKGAGYTYISIFGWIFTIWASILLILSMFSALLEIINAFWNAFGSGREGIFNRIIAIIALPFIIAVQGYIIFICAETIKGIWSKSDAVNYSQYGWAEKIASKDLSDKHTTF